ncbi:hypothetical protein V7S76_13175, partial [Aquirufa sp. ROCK2-A2]
DNAHRVCASGSKKIAESVVKIGQLADSSWINWQKISFFVSFFLKKRNAMENKLTNKWQCYIEC